jgi:hypothetical protein
MRSTTIQLMSESRVGPNDRPLSKAFIHRQITLIIDDDEDEQDLGGGIRQPHRRVRTEITIPADLLLELARRAHSNRTGRAGIGYRDGSGGAIVAKAVDPLRVYAINPE